MTTPEPMPGSEEAPFISAAADRMYQRLPRVYRLLDAQNEWALKRYLAGAMAFAGDLDTMIGRIRGSRPVGPADPEPFDLDPEDLERWRRARLDVNSALTDPDLAEPHWLSYIAQLLGASLHPQASLAERRDTIRFATSGYRGGTRAALADAARSVLTGSRFVLVQPFTLGSGAAGTVWDVTLRTRTSETPDAEAVLEAVERKGAKPAGVKLWHATFGTNWDRVEALFPAWDDWDSRTWDVIEEAGITYADVEDNLAPGASFESSGDVAMYTAVAVGGGSVPTWALQVGAGIDGANTGRLTKVGGTGGMGLRLTTALTGAPPILPDREYTFSLSARPDGAATLQLGIEFQNAGGGVISTATSSAATLLTGEWNRVPMTATSPAGTAKIVLVITVPATVAAGRIVDLDAVLFRLVSAGG